MKTEEIIEEINRLMNEYEDIMFRPLPYLGVVWRGIEPDFEGKIRFSKPDGSNFYYWDMAWKWDYPMVELSLDEARPILEKTLTVLNAVMELVGVLEEMEQNSNQTAEKE